MSKHNANKAQSGYSKPSWLQRLIPASMTKRWDRWLTRRLPPQKHITLSHRSIFILPSGFGLFWMGLIVLLYLFGTNYQNNLVIGLSLLLASVFHTCIIYSYKNLAGLSFNAVNPPIAYAGDDSPFPIMLTGHTSNKHSDTSHQQICLQFKHQRHVRLKHMEQQSVAAVPFEHPKRGHLTPGRIKVSSNFPLGLCRAWSYVDLDIHHVIFAKPEACDIVLSSQLSDSDSQHEHGKLRPGVDDYKGLRAYVPGESLKQVAWKQWAQDKGMLSKEFAEPEGLPVWLSLAQTSGKDLEQQLSRLAWQVDKLSQTQQIFGLILGNTVINQHTGEAHRIACQTAIATYQAYGSINPDFTPSSANLDVEAT
ncbi:DUF58 domain-containing protein [Shewanella phaeophyticola]|uniref:DUF58 domain-containing protein n=1 Tax=Shewanella phaeophyticola TaxID=2978345 RepID=A0ABT2P070_9GAMM|nr:DUF58 domain-containing protein [Shewanella sp. KJ10-1]MCT8986043.1 DUF58 domain-containing protein [Shewanella sp. KJ10-1]